MDQVSRELLVGAFDLHTHGFPELHNSVGMALGLFRAGRVGQVPRNGRVRPQVPHLAGDGPHLSDPSEGGWDQNRGRNRTQFPTRWDRTRFGRNSILQGARAVFFPTWTSANDLTNGGFSSVIRKELPSLGAFMKNGLSAIDDSGNLTRNARDVLRMAKDAGILVSTGHLSGRIGVALAREADRIGFRRLVVSHPDSRSVGATDEEIVEAAKCSAYIEWTFIGMLPMTQRIKPQTVAEWITRLGPASCVLPTDTFGPSSLPEPDQFQMYLGILHELGISAGDIKLMSADTPVSLVSGTGNQDD